MPICAPKPEHKAIIPVDRVVSDGELLWETLGRSPLPGGSPGETAYHAPGVVVIGDAVTNLDGFAGPAGENIAPTCHC